MKTIKLMSIVMSLLLAGQVMALNVGDTAPDFTLSKQEGGAFTLSDHSGKVVFLFSFGYGCGHCISNGPNTESIIYQTFKDNPNFVAVGLDNWDGSAGQVAGFKSTTGISYSLLLDASSVVSSYGMVTDNIAVVDQNGKIAYITNNFATQAVSKDAKELIQRLLQTASIYEPASSASLQVRYTPASQSLILDHPFEANKQVEYRIMDASGRIIQENSLPLTARSVLPIAHLNRGLYFLVLSDGVSSYSAKFLK